MIPPRILVVDDSIVVRMILNKLLISELNADVVMAANGELALEKAVSQPPDLVILDIEMPKMDGMETLRALHNHNPNIPIVMFSAITEADAEITLNALSLGASDFLSKHNEFNNGEIPLTYLRKELIPKVSALLTSSLSKKSVPIKNGSKPLNTSQSQISSKPRHPISILAIAVSTGGPIALEKLLGSFPKSLPIPIVIVQHIPVEFTVHLVQTLSKKCAIKVFQCEDGLELEKGCAYIAKGGRHMEVINNQGRIQLGMNDAPPENSCRPSGDVLFRSVARVYGPSALGLVLTGMGQDGLNGCHALKEKGSHIIAQDEATSVIWGMPGAIVRAGLADSILPIESIPSRIMSFLA